MGLNAAKVPMGGNRKATAPLEPDVYRARPVQLIDLGLQPQRPYQGQEKPPAHEIMLTYELCDEFMKDDEGNDIEDKPRWISENFPLHPLRSDKARSTKRLFAFDPKDGFQGDFTKCIGIPVNVTVVNNVSGDTVYSNVGNVAPMSPKKAATCPELVNKAKVFDLEAPDLDVFNALPGWLQEKIKGNLNFQGSPLQRALGGAPAPEQKKPEANQQDNNPY